MDTPTGNLQRITKRLRLRSLIPLDLLRAYAAIVDELWTRRIVRTKNNPVADYAEWMVVEKLGLTLEGNSRSGYDAVGPDGTRYQIKSRRITRESKSAQLSAIRRLDEDPFDFVTAVIFEADFSIRYAAKIPREVIAELSRYTSHTNAHVFHFRDTVLEDPRVEDITHMLDG